MSCSHHKLHPKHEDLETYQAEQVDETVLDERADAQCEQYCSIARQVGLPDAPVRELRAGLIRAYVRVDMLALRYQRRHLQFGGLVYLLAAAAVGVAAFQALFYPHRPALIFIEVGLMAVVLAIVAGAHYQRWHNRWIDYRLLAERFRIAFFLAITGVDLLPLCPRSMFNVSVKWIDEAFAAVWTQLPPHDPPDPSLFEALRAFVVKAWIEDQLGFHERSSKRYASAHRRLSVAGNTLFGLTFAAAALHACGVVPLHGVLAFLAVVLPALGGALGAIRHQREYLKNAKRYEAMAERLREIRDRMARATDLDPLQREVREAAELMLHENADWQMVVWVSGLEPPG